MEFLPEILLSSYLKAFRVGFRLQPGAARPTHRGGPGITYLSLLRLGFVTLKASFMLIFNRGAGIQGCNSNLETRGWGKTCFQQQRHSSVEPQRRALLL